jgi:hypothetical protein
VQDPVGPNSWQGRWTTAAAAHLLVLRKGTNVLVFKVMNHTGSRLGCARFVDREGNPAKGLLVSLTPEP